MDEKYNEYSRSLAIPVYDVGPGDTLKLGAALRLVQETSEQHLARLGVGYEALRKETGLVFFIVSVAVKIFRFPRHGEKIRISTRPRGQNRAEYYRDFRFFGPGDEPLLTVMQVTVLADARTHRVKRVRNLAGFGDRATMPVDPAELAERFPMPADLPPLGERRVFHSDLDANGHVNNAVYGDTVWDFLPPDVRRAAREIRIDYRGETEEGDALRVSGGSREGKYYLNGQNANGLSFYSRILCRADEAD